MEPSESFVTKPSKIIGITPKNVEGTEVQSSRIIGNTPKNVEGTEVQEVTAQISVPHEGGWGWVVVASAFFSIFILDGVAYTFGSVLTDISKDLQVADSLVALVNSTAVALYFTASPLASALINRYGFRVCAMSGSIVCSLALCLAHVTAKFAYLFLCYGIIAGFGFSLINMSSSLVVGFYFEKLRSVALAIATCGSSVGVMTLYPANTMLVHIGGWRPTTLLHSGLFGIIFFLGMTYRPLVPLSVKIEEDTSIRTLAYLPSVTSTKSTASTFTDTKPYAASEHKSKLSSTATERLFNAVSNINFPTAASIVKDASESTVRTTTSAQAGPSKLQSKSRLTLTPNIEEGAITHWQLKQVQSMISKASEPGNIDLQIKKLPPVKRNIWQRLFNWEKHHAHARPMYRDDVFYEGKLKDLHAYQKSIVDTKPEDRTGLEYQMAVTRTAAIKDLQDTRGVFTTAVRRVLATMMDPSLLKKTTFLLMCCSGFFTYLGFLVPYVYLQDRNLKAGIDPKHCSFFISTIGLSNAFGRLILGSIASKIDPIKLFAFWCSIAGISTIVSSISYNLYYQYMYCCIFGFSISCVACLRSLILVSLYGLDKLTNATGMMLIFLGIGNLISTPVAGMLKNNFGYEVAFYVAGVFMTISGFILVLVKIYAVKEKKEEEIKNKQQEAKNKTKTKPQQKPPKPKPVKIKDQLGTRSKSQS